MATRRLIWSEEAKTDAQRIFDFWNHRNKSKTYSRKLSKVFLGVANGILRQPYLGTKISQKDLCYVIVEKKFLMAYRVKSEVIEILSIWDGRRKPEDFEKLINKRN